MANSRCVLGLALQLPTRALAVRVGFSGGSLESDVPTVVLVDRTPDLTHSRGTGYLFQPVPASDQLASTHAPPSPPSSQQHCGRSPTDPYCTDSRQSVPGYSPAMASPPSAAVLVRLSPADSGEILTLQRAAYVSEAQAHGDLELPPLVQSLEELAAELADPQVLALGLREGARLLAAVRIRLDGDSADLGRLTVVPDRRVRAWAAACCAMRRNKFPHGVHQLRLFTGEHSLANQRLYQRHGYLEDGRTAAGHYQLVHMTKVLPRGN